MKVSVCVPTYKRPLLLLKLLDSLLASAIDQNLISFVDVIIVDNDPGGSARQIVEEKLRSIKSPFSLHYRIYPIKGMMVRNELLRIAYSLDPDFIVFVDDDEYVIQEWLGELVRTIMAKKSDAVMGPVLPKFEKPVPDYISCWFSRELYEDQSRIFELKTCNLILRASDFQKMNLWFDHRFNKTGSDDTFLGIQMMNRGSEFYWSSKAIAYETIPDSRANLSWLIKRKFRTGSTFTYILKIESKWGLLVKRFATSAAYIVIGVLSSVFIFLPIKKRFWGILKLANGAGGLSGFVNILYKEYD